MKTKKEKNKQKKSPAILKNNSKVFSDAGLQGRKAKVLKRDNTTKLLWGLSLISLVLVMVVVGQFFVMETQDPSNVLHNGTVINGVNVGGMESLEAEQLIYEVFKEKSNNFSLSLNYGDKNWTFNKNDFKVNSEIHTIIEEAQKRNAIVDDYNLQTAKLNQMQKQGVSLNVAFNYIFVGLDEKIDEIVKQIEIEPINSQITFEPKNKNCFKITEHKDGLRVNKEQLYFDINEQFNKTNQVSVQIPIVVENAQVTYEDNVKNTSKISTYTTYVSDSTGGRKSNVTKALNHFNGYVINPGEEVSFNKVSGPHTLENGYKIATVIYNGQFVDGVGGGVCQASTTLYNALLLADVEILEVHKHTLPLKYVPLALDSMVSDYVADLKFKNNSEHPIYVQTVCDSESVTVNLFGYPLEHQIKLRSETICKLEPSGDTIVADTKKEYVDKVLFKGEQFRLTYPRVGYEAKAFVEYYVNGELIKQKEIRHEYYNPQNGIIVEGVEDVPAGMTAIQGSVNLNNMQNNNANINNDGFIPTNVSP